MSCADRWRRTRDCGCMGPCRTLEAIWPISLRRPSTAPSAMWTSSCPASPTCRHAPGTCMHAPCNALSGSNFHEFCQLSACLPGSFCHWLPLGIPCHGKALFKQLRSQSICCACLEDCCVSACPEAYVICLLTLPVYVRAACPEDEVCRQQYICLKRHF